VPADKRDAVAGQLAALVGLTGADRDALFQAFHDAKSYITVARRLSVLATFYRTCVIDGILERVERLSGLVEQAASSPLVKIISVGAGLRKGASRFKKHKPTSPPPG